MKRMCIAAGLAPAALGLTQKQVSAWCRFNFSTGINVTYENNGGAWSFLGFSKTTPPPPGVVAAVPPPAVAAPYPAGAAPPAAPAGPPAVPAPTPANGNNGSSTTSTQRTSFYNPTAYPFADYHYSNYSSAAAAPSYWYGK